MKKYNSEDYFSVINKKTGKKIVDCAEWSDAMFMFDLDPYNRQIIRNKFLMSSVIDIEMPKLLPTNDIVGGVNSSTKNDGKKDTSLPQIKLPDRQSKPFLV